jgi:hypothetical protein
MSIAIAGMPKPMGVGLHCTSSGERGFHLGKPSIVKSVGCLNAYVND